MQVGAAISFLVPPLIVNDHPNVEDIGKDLRLMFYYTAGICTAICLFVVIGIFLRSDYISV